MTIEERARKYATKLVGGWYEGGLKGNMWDTLYNRYLEIAKEQQEIDMEKAWELFQKYATYVHPRKGIETCVMTKYQFLEAMKGE